MLSGVHAPRGTESTPIDPVKRSKADVSALGLPEPRQGHRYCLWHPAKPELAAEAEMAAVGPICKECFTRRSNLKRKGRAEEKARAARAAAARAGTLAAPAADPSRKRPRPQDGQGGAGDHRKLRKLQVAQPVYGRLGTVDATVTVFPSLLAYEDWVREQTLAGHSMETYAVDFEANVTEDKRFLRAGSKRLSVSFISHRVLVCAQHGGGAAALLEEANVEQRKAADLYGGDGLLSAPQAEQCGSSGLMSFSGSAERAARSGSSAKAPPSPADTYTHKVGVKKAAARRHVGGECQHIVTVRSDLNPLADGTYQPGVVVVRVRGSHSARCEALAAAGESHYRTDPDAEAVG